MFEGESLTRLWNNRESSSPPARASRRHLTRRGASGFLFTTDTDDLGERGFQNTKQFVRNFGFAPKKLFADPAPIRSSSPPPRPHCTGYRDDKNLRALVQITSAFGRGRPFAASARMRHLILPAFASGICRPMPRARGCRTATRAVVRFVIGSASGKPTRFLPQRTSPARRDRDPSRCECHQMRHLRRRSSHHTGQLNAAMLPTLP